MNRATQWLNANRYRRYPFVDDAVPTLDGDTTIPDDLLLDFQIADYGVAPTAGQTLIRLVDITFSTTGVRQADLKFAYGGPSTTYTVTVPLNAAFPYTATLQTSSVYMQVVVGAGLVILSDAKPVDATYTAAGTELQPTLVALQHKHRIQSLTGDAAGSVAVSGDVYWEEGYSMRIELNEGAGQLRLNASPGAGAGFPCDVVDPSLPDCSDVLVGLNDVYGGVEGETFLVGGHGIAIVPDPTNNRIIIRTGVQDVDIECNE